MATFTSKQTVFAVSASIATYCTQNPTATFTDAANCAKYYDCRKRVHYIQFDMYESECPYKQLYDTVRGTCKPYNQVDCGHRWEPKSPCKYTCVCETRDAVSYNIYTIQIQLRSTTVFCLVVYISDYIRESLINRLLFGNCSETIIYF